MYNRCVRNDPNKKGLLFAGLETGVYVSFDDGNNWQSLQLNLPTAPVVDIQIHKGERDIVIATHGRSFWILDDITPLYELNPSSNGNSIVYKIHEAYRTPGPNWNSDDADDQSGENEPVGVKVRYYLKDKSDKELKMVFYEKDGDEIITYSDKYDNKRTPITTKNEFYENKKKAEDGRLNSSKGMYSFIWDMRYPEAEGDTSATFDASLQGPLAIPGNYTVKLFLGDELIGEQQFIIKIDPRNPATQNDLQAQFDLNKKICDKLNEMADAISTIKDIRSQIEAYLKTEEDSMAIQSFRKVAQPIIDSLTAIEERLHNPKILAYEDNLKFPIVLEEKLAGLNYFLQMSDTAPTKSMYEKYDDLNARINVEFNKLNAIINKEVNMLNDMAGVKTMKLIEVGE